MQEGEESPSSDHECEVLSRTDTESIPSTSLEQGSQKPKLTKKEKQKGSFREKRRTSRREVQKAEGTTLKAVSIKKRQHVMAQAIALPTEYEEDFTPSKPGWKGQPDHASNSAEYSLDDLVSKFNMKVIQWDGRQVFSSILLEDD